MRFTTILFGLIFFLLYSTYASANCKPDFTLPSESIISYDKAININPNYSLAYLRRSQAKQNSKDSFGAKLDLLKFKNLVPNSIVADYKLSRLEQWEGNYNLAI